MQRPRAFTLIELLVVVAIIAILAAVAVPNFLEAQTRAKVSRAKADLRTLSTALESYMVDNNRYPDIPRGSASLNPPAFPAKGTPGYAWRVLPLLSTPIAYTTSGILPDIFGTATKPPSFLGYANLRAIEQFPDLAALGIFAPSDEVVRAYRDHAYLLLSMGPDQYDFCLNAKSDSAQGAGKAFEFLTARHHGVGLNFVYDPSNGTLSTGDIARTANGECR